MCGRINVTDDPFLQALMQSLGIEAGSLGQRFDIRPTEEVPLITQVGELQSAVWWLAMEPNLFGLSPAKQWTTFNARAERLFSSPIHKQSPVSKRGIVLASGFYEWKGKQAYLIRPQKHKAIAFAAMYKQWPLDDGFVYSCAIVTLPPHSRFMHIHEKSIPLMLGADEYETWLNPATPRAEIDRLLQSRINQDLEIFAVDRVDWPQLQGADELLLADVG